MMFRRQRTVCVTQWQRYMKGPQPNSDLQNCHRSKQRLQQLNTLQYLDNQNVRSYSSCAYIVRYLDNSGDEQLFECLLKYQFQSCGVWVIVTFKQRTHHGAFLQSAGNHLLYISNIAGLRSGLIKLGIIFPCDKPAQLQVLQIHL